MNVADIASAVDLGSAPEAALAAALAAPAPAAATEPAPAVPASLAFLSELLLPLLLLFSLPLPHPLLSKDLPEHDPASDPPPP